MQADKAVKAGFEALARYPGGGLAGAVNFLGGTRAAAKLLGLGIRQVQLWLAGERQGQPGAPKQFRRISNKQFKAISGHVNERALQLAIERARDYGLVVTMTAWLLISNKPFKRTMGPVLIDYDPEDEETGTPLLTLLCDAASRHKWKACAGFLFAAFFIAYDFQEAHLAEDEDDEDLELTPEEGQAESGGAIEEIAFTYGPEQLDRPSPQAA